MVTTTIKKDGMAARAARTATLAPGIEDRLKHAQTFVGQHPVDDGPMARPLSAQAPLGTNVADYLIGQVYDVPILYVREGTSTNAREFYPSQEVDQTGISMATNGQDVPARGYVKFPDDGSSHGAVVVLIDGQKRLRAALQKGIQILRIDITTKPKDDLEAYLASRRINLQRSTQTVLDDAVRFKQLWDAQRFATQNDLAKAMEMSQPMVSRVLALNAIPRDVMNRMVEFPALTALNAAHAISQIFESPKFADDPEGAHDLAVEIIGDCGGELSSTQVVKLVEQRLAGPKTRARKQSRDFVYSGVKGTIKYSEGRGELLVGIRGLTSTDLDDLRKKFEAVLLR